MKTLFAPAKDAKAITVHVGEWRVSGSGDVISALLGSCVGVALYCPVSKSGGLNHYMLSDVGTVGCVDDEDKGRYGVQAIEGLVKDLVARGAHQAHLQAKVFGGGHGSASEDTTIAKIADDNVKIAFETLDRLGVAVTASEVGGRIARRVALDTASGIVQVRKIPWNQREKMK